MGRVGRGGQVGLVDRVSRVGSETHLPHLPHLPYLPSASPYPRTRISRGSPGIGSNVNGFRFQPGIESASYTDTWLGS